jgi:PKD repeat protein
MAETHPTWISGSLLALVVFLVTATPTRAYPVAILAADPLTGMAPLTVEFDGSDSWDTQGLPVIRYTWNFNDGSPLVDGKDFSHVKHIFRKPGIYSVYLTVYNELGHSKTAYQIIKVAATPTSR